MIARRRYPVRVMMLAGLLAGCGDGSSSPTPQPLDAAATPPTSGPVQAGAAGDPVGAPTPIIFGANQRTIAARRVVGATRSSVPKDNVGSSSPIMPPAFR